MSFHKLRTHTRADRATFKSNSYLGWQHVVWNIQAKRSVGPIHTNRHNRVFEMRDLSYLKASIRKAKAKWGRDSGLIVCIACGIRDITIGITRSFRSGNGIEDPYHGQRPSHICQYACECWWDKNVVWALSGQTVVIGGHYKRLLWGLIIVLREW